MCGIAGCFDFNKILSPQELGPLVSLMRDALYLRGPDDAGLWVDLHNGVALGHRRLAIIDLTPEGRQPMASACGRYVIVFNGEIYNYQEIRRELDHLRVSPAWRGHSDTEVMVAAICHFGLESAVKKFEGMFAFALWDKEERVLHLCRDRIGEKPLYFGIVEGSLLFGSELKALLAHPKWRGDIDRSSLSIFLRYGCIPSPHSIYKNIFKISPGTILTLDKNILSQNNLKDLIPYVYWSAAEVVEKGLFNQFATDEKETIGELERLLSNVIKGQMISDVPLGAFLSGGIDSSTVVSLMQAQSAKPVRTFTIGVESPEYDEAGHAKAVARHLGTEHHELYVTDNDALATIPLLSGLYDEPFADSSQIPTFLVAKMTREHVTVSLSGDGGDELFGGYDKYFIVESLWRKFGWMPGISRTLFVRLLSAFSPEVLNSRLRFLSYIILDNKLTGKMSDKIKKFSEVLEFDSPEDLFFQVISAWKNPNEIVVGGEDPHVNSISSINGLNFGNFKEKFMAWDLVTYLPDDILVKVDRAAMGVSLETRIPLLSHRVVEFAWRVPLQMKIKNGKGKWLLRELLYKHVPKSLIDRPKKGFAIPIADWLRGPLKDWASALLSEERIASEGFFYPEPVRQKWQEHLSGHYNWQFPLWNVLMFQSWLENTRKQ